MLFIYNIGHLLEILSIDFVVGETEGTALARFSSGRSGHRAGQGISAKGVRRSIV